jgi:hemolysin III
MDHCAIYLLIAGSYTPFTLVTLRGGWGWTLFGIVWGLSVFGILFKVFLVYRYRLLSTPLYLAMGWMALIAIKPLIAAVPRNGIAWIVAGGLSYTVGAVFYGWKRIPFNHALWHVFVLAGSICHYLAVVFYVVPEHP